MTIDNLILQFDTCCMKKSQAQTATTNRGSPRWQNSHYANLIRYVPSGRYFARVRIGGKLIRQSLKTKTLTVAKLKLADLEKKEREKLENSGRLESGKVVCNDLLAEYRKRLDADTSIKPRTKSYRLECIQRILKTWPSLPSTDARKVSKDACSQWAGKFVTQASPQSFNNTVGTLRMIFDIAVEKGVRYTNPCEGIKRARIRPKQLTLPTQSQFLELVAEIRRVPFGPGLASADLVEFLAYGGFRKGEAKFITWGDCDFERLEIVVRGHPEHGTKNGKVRRVPMIPDMVTLLRRLQKIRQGEEVNAPVMRVSECQGAITRSCKALGITRITHHDLRHLFATRCIESGVDIPTVSRWLGHADGGALAMKVYGHLRDQHSAAMASKVSFQSQAKPAPEVVAPVIK